MTCFMCSAFYMHCFFIAFAGAVITFFPTNFTYINNIVLKQNIVLQSTSQYVFPIGYAPLPLDLFHYTRNISFLLLAMESEKAEVQNNS